MNVSYVVAVAIALVWIAGRWHPAIFLRTPRPYLILLVAAPLVAGYCWLGGYSPSLYRAVLMARATLALSSPRSTDLTT